MIYRITGFLLLIETAMLLCCGGVSLLYHEDDLISFLQSASLTALMGVVLLLSDAEPRNNWDAATDMSSLLLPGWLSLFSECSPSI